MTLTTRPCSDCTLPFMALTHQAVRCESCKAILAAAKKMRDNAAARAARPIITCVDCKREFAANCKRVRMCLKCARRRMGRAMGRQLNPGVANQGDS